MRLTDSRILLDTAESFVWKMIFSLWFKHNYCLIFLNHWNHFLSVLTKELFMKGWLLSAVSCVTFSLRLSSMKFADFVEFFHIFKMRAAGSFQRVFQPKIIFRGFPKMIFIFSRWEPPAASSIISSLRSSSTDFPELFSYFQDESRGRPPVYKPDFPARFLRDFSKWKIGMRSPLAAISSRE